MLVLGLSCISMDLQKRLFILCFFLSVKTSYEEKRHRQSLAFVLNRRVVKSCQVHRFSKPKRKLSRI